jgi:hypothetical protein
MQIKNSFGMDKSKLPQVVQDRLKRKIDLRNQLKNLDIVAAVKE